MILSVFAIPVFADSLEWYSKWSNDFAVETDEEATNRVAYLYSGRNNAVQVGRLYIDSLGGNRFHVTYEIYDEWNLAQVHFEAIDDDDLTFISKKNGNLIPGKFTVNEEFDPYDDDGLFSFIYEADSEVVNFAAHAVVEKYDECTCTSYSQTAWGIICGEQWKTKGNWSHYFYPFD